VDILGFSNYVYSAFREPKTKLRDGKIQNIADLNVQIAKELAKIADGHHKISFSHFSDSIFLSVPVKVDDAIGQLFYRVQRISTALLIRGFLTRGGIVRGAVHYRDGDVFGPGLIEAYQLETTVARHPRIVVGKSVRDSIGSNDDGWRKLIKASDGPYYLNCIQIFEDLAEAVRKKGFPDLFSDEKYKSRFSFLTAVCVSLNTQLDHNRDNPRVYEKLRWIADEINARVLRKGDATFPNWPKLLYEEEGL
jgi:hypothetical protein